MENIAEVVLRQGKLHLSVAGFYLATEGGSCVDPEFSENRWNKSSLEKVARLINEYNGG